ncbi:RNA 3'-terminal phosphate cyclase-like protein [Giardia muris]|uniref:RNA 3'-terminal phosphate cyclase-like protein n=1 Tax=Giardia muris TaxID=5742 RepID=A0A4Z1SRD6_GIAMU|nr:RNA 3'-terminal phosphate cyclase-like protein [Giardia muris]|eukprot:TNJ28452.1 RNA 3'-terminal phosphate cyclase-like protein [Giardia muris]
MQFQSAEDFRLKIVLSVLSGKALRITSPTPFEDHEIAFMKLVVQLSDNCKAVLQPTGRSLSFVPGAMRGGVVAFECPLTRGIGYYVEMLLLLCLLAKYKTVLTLTGITNENTSLSVDTIRDVTIKQVRWFGLEEDDISLIVEKRGFQPEGGGCVTLTVHPKETLGSIDLGRLALFEKVEGHCISALLPPALANRALTAAKGELLKVLANVYVTADHATMKRAGKSKGFGLCLTATTVTGSVVGAELYTDTKDTDFADPEAMGVYVARVLMTEAQYLGSPDMRHQPLILLFMAATTANVSRCRFGPLTHRTVRTLRLIEAFLGIKFLLEPKTVQFEEEYRSEEEWKKDGRKTLYRTKQMAFVVVSCRGRGVQNINKTGF